ncbi:TonB-dependent receptor [bacterium]|nr:TonB-dependent receptor [bacterium]MBU1634108.1 TonB-dependent receptor [bacterium]MBU1872527.1 TonB-dependent receptor [bacterium]
MFKTKNATVTLLIGCLLNAVTVFGGTTGKIAGRIIDKESGEPLVGVNVVIEDSYLGASSDSDGRYFIINISPGVYSVQVSMIGYELGKVANVQVSVDLTTKMDFELSATVLDMGEKVVVIAKKPLVQNDATAQISSVNGSTIAEKLPVSDINDVLAMQAGFSKDQQGKLHLRGGRYGEITYMVDGVYVSDPFIDPFSNKFAGTATSSDAMAELQVLSGTFNAEYGNSMSGVVNIVTKEGDDSYHVKFQYESPALNESPYHSTDWLLSTDEVKNLSSEEQEQYLDAWKDDNGNSLYEFESVINDETFKDLILVPVLGDFSLNIDGPVPLIPKMTFLLSGRFKNEDGYLPWGFELVRDIMGKVTYKFNPKIKLCATIERSQDYHQDYSHYYKYYKYYEQTGIGAYGLVKEWRNRELITWAHTLNRSTFYTLRLSHLVSHFEFKDTGTSVWYDTETGVLDSSTYLESIGAGGFVQGGTDYWWENESETYNVKFDLTSQIHQNHQIKTGFEVKQHEIFRHYIQNLTKTGAANNLEYYRQKPLEAALYLQDKIEYDYLIINLGLRLDYFDTQTSGWTDMGDIGYVDSNGVYQSNATVDVSPRYHISPRIGLAHPFSDNSMLHFSYGHFLQNPAYSSMYVNRSVWASAALIGDVMMKPQKTVAFEIGLKHAFSSSMVADATVFLKDITNLIGSTYYSRYPYDYTIYNNSDFARVQGFILIVENQFSNYLSGMVNYTYSIAEGNESDPSEGFSNYNASNYYLRPNREYYLDFDRRHVFSANADLRFPDDYGFSLWGFRPLENSGINVVLDVASGLPYTPILSEGQTTVDKNSERMSWTVNLDLRVNRNFRVAGFEGSVFMKVNNLFDRLNVVNVWKKTGEAWDEGNTSSYTYDRQADPSNIGIRRCIKIGLYIKI